MKQKNQKKKGFAPRRGGKKGSVERDPFFEEESKKRRKVDYDDEDIESMESDEDENGFSGGGSGGEEDKEDEEAEDEFAHETAGERRKRLAEETLRRIREAKNKEMEELYDDEGREEEDGVRDSLVAKALMQEQLEESGRVRKAIATRVQEPESADGFRVMVKHRQSVTAVALSDDDSRGFSASKDGSIFHWDVSSGKRERYRWPSDEILKSHGVKDPVFPSKKHSRETTALAVSFDGRYLASGGLDRHIHLWDTRTLEHVQVFPGHRGPVSCLCFRQGTVELFSGSYDRTVKIWNAEDKSYISTLFGHQDEVLTIDCLRRERVLTVGRDRTMQLFKVPEESRLVFRAPASSLECCCFISNDEFLSGSDNGTIALWTMLRKKPVYIVKNAHPVTDGEMANGSLENGGHVPDNYNCSSANSWVNSVSVCRGSDLAASGAGNGSVRLWAIESESKAIQPLHQLPLSGFVNSLAFARSGQFLIAGVGKEPRLGRWGSIKSAQNGVAIHPLRLS
ncbi:PREDICTED: U3 snoRNP-associated protein-like YAO [Tarenaya hassleriana]|uniref:U3 snoRNP-associated protein-like YAO n=1 Tax=Tarenaya hassleriana TaxID=28532 RepID=UPI00053C1C07|nr:PREDICTED: U3 snoRNP-associated protein-like YAO [Tarenaya hassleriana]